MCCKNEGTDSHQQQQEEEEKQEQPGLKSPPFSKKLRILCLHGFRQNAKGFKGRTSSLAKKLKHMADLIFIDAPHQLPFIYHPLSTSIAPPPPPPYAETNTKFAWFVAPGFPQNQEKAWISADTRFDCMQYKNQSEGSDTSMSYLTSVLARSGPFDGVVGFSQGAAAAAMLCARKMDEDGVCFRFVILCSGFAINMAEEQRGSIKLPSLHIFGRVEGRGDRQICNNASKDLVSFFHPCSSVVIEHESGHIIPTTHPYIDLIKSFLCRFF